jgi:outer membrane protein OmpA-like peptidoglycan-associated protein
VHAKAAHGGATSGKAAIPFNFGEDDAAPPADGGTAPGAPMPSLKTASLPPHAGAAAHGSSDEHQGLTKRGAVMFEKGAADPSPAQFSGVKLLAGDLTTALESGASRVQLEAYGGAPGDKSSDARRLSLKRALAVRQLLIDNGVPSNRIDVRAMGGADDKGPTDRVDVFLRAG